MVTRRELVTTGALGSLGTMVGTSAEVQSPETISAQALREMAADLDEIRVQMREAFIGPSLSQGVIADIRRQFAIFLKSNQKYPDFCEIGPTVFTDLYDWHVRHQLAIEVSRVDNRMAIRFMFSWMVLRPEQADTYVGIPYDRG